MSSSCYTAATLETTKSTLNETIAAATLSASSCDVSLNALMASNALLSSQLASSRNIANDGYGETAQTIPVIYIAIIFIILYSLLGLFYNQILTQSIIPLMGNLLDYKMSETSYHEIWNKINNTLNKFRFILFIFVFLLLFAVNIGIIYILILKGTRKNYAMKVVSIAIFAITGLTFLLTNNVNFVKIFENTIGYAIASFFPPTEGKTFSEFINNLFKHNTFVDGIDYGFLFTVFRLDNFGDIIKDISKVDETTKKTKYDFTFRDEVNDDDLQHLAKCVVRKNTIGYFCWIIFSSIATTMISVKFLSKNL